MMMVGRLKFSSPYSKCMMAFCWVTRQFFATFRPKGVARSFPFAETLLVESSMKKGGSFIFDAIAKFLFTAQSLKEEEMRGEGC